MVLDLLQQSLVNLDRFLVLATSEMLQSLHSLDVVYELDLVKLIYKYILCAWQVLSKLLQSFTSFENILGENFKQKLCVFSLFHHNTFVFAIIDNLFELKLREWRKNNFIFIRNEIV